MWECRDCTRGAGCLAPLDQGPGLCPECLAHVDARVIALEDEARRLREELRVYQARGPS